MSSTFYIDGWNEKKSTGAKVYAHVEFPNLEIEYFINDPSYLKDEGGYYRLEDLCEYPDLYCNGGNLVALLKAIGYLDSSDGTFPSEQLSELRVKLIKFINSEKKVESVAVGPSIKANVYYGGVSSSTIATKAEALLKMVMIAIKEKSYIYWA
jgi:hypothetical protein